MQAIVLPVSDVFMKYAQKVQKALAKKGVRVTLDDTNESLGKKIRNAEKQKIPWMLVVGEKEAGDKAVAARNYHTKKQEVVALSTFTKAIVSEIKERKLPEGLSTLKRSESFIFAYVGFVVLMVGSFSAANFRDLLHLHRPSCAILS